MPPSSEREDCPKCSSGRVAEIIFGIPCNIADLLPLLDRGELILGGCDISPDPPKFHCHDCSHEWGQSAWKAIMEAAAEQQKRKFQELELEAEARGVMTASANSHGFVKCPHCAMNFSIRHSMSWDGKMHKSCHTRLRVSNWENA